MHFFGAQLFALYALTVLVFGCGAPLKSADEVAPIFDNAKSLSTKMLEICDLVSNNQAEPNFSNIQFDRNGCEAAGTQSQDLKPNTEIILAEVKTRKGNDLQVSRNGTQPAIASSATPATDSSNEIAVGTRLQIWLNRPLLKMVQVLVPALNKKTEAMANDGSTATTQQEQSKFKIKIIGKPQFDQENMSLKLELSVDSKRSDNSMFDISNRFVINGGLIKKKYIFATITTAAEADVKTSLIKRGKILLFVVPHAKDIYVDVVTDMTFHAFGVDAAMQEQILQFLRKALRMIPDFLEKAENL